MSKLDRKALTRAYKERSVPVGVFAVTCTASGEVWVKASRNLDNQANRVWVTLRFGGHPNRTLQAAWTAHGEAAFEYRLLETLDDPDLGAHGLELWLKTRADHWRQQLGASALTG